MEIVCPVHGKFFQLPVMHKSGQGCPKCGRVKIAESLTTQWNDVLQSFTSLHGNQYVYYPETYTVLEQPMAMECKKHGKFFQTPKNHRNGSGCPVCNSSKGEKLIERKLRDLGIEFVHQMKFPDLSNYLRFDFFIPTLNLVIEFNGLQHYEPVVYFGGDKSLDETKRRDSIKLNYCLEKGISHEIIRFDEDFNIRINEIIEKYCQ
jgi:Zn finger protein HypA/HybF involved in hydrogenase expression